MTTDLEKQFFDTFGIEPSQWYKIRIDKDDKFYSEPTDKRYPQITDRILLELICIAMDVTYFGASDVEALKNVVLEVLIDEIKSEYSTKKEKKHIVNQIQALFKEIEQ